MFSDHHKIFSQAQISSISISYIIDTIKHQREKNSGLVGLETIKMQQSELVLKVRHNCNAAK